MINDIRLYYVILNGEPFQETIAEYREKGWIILYTDKAKRFHPYACETDTIMFMAKPINKEAYDAEMNEFRESHNIQEISQ